MTKHIITCEHCCQPFTVEQLTDRIARVFKPCGCELGYKEGEEE